MRSAAPRLSHAHAARYTCAMGISRGRGGTHWGYTLNALLRICNKVHEAATLSAYALSACFAHLFDASFVSSPPAVVDLGQREQGEEEEHNEEQHERSELAPLVAPLEVILFQKRLALQEDRVVVLPLVDHQRSPCVLHQVHVGVPLPVHWGVCWANQKAGEEQQGDDIRGQDGVGRLHVGRQGGDEVREDDAVAEGEVVHQPEQEEGARELDGIEHHGGDDQGDAREHQHFIEHLANNVRHRVVQPVCALAHEQRSLHHDLRHVRRRTERRQGGPHEQHGGNVDHVVGGVVVTDAPVQSEDEDREEHLVAKTRAQELPVGVVLPGAVLHHNPEGPPAGGGGGAGGGQLSLSLNRRFNPHGFHLGQQAVALPLERRRLVYLCELPRVAPPIRGSEDVDEPLDIAVPRILGRDAREPALRVPHQCPRVRPEVHLHARA
mmetsp:Transcript_43513/g.70032  ORF Transcript_43513/g.70032 Transcript_43513/m.70032 type:complete len:437 (-) Transcript_43513:982-2292(-)